MNLEYNEDGSIKLPKNIIEAREKFIKKVKKAEENPEKVIVSYEEISSNYEDNWIITLPKNIPSNILFTLQKWANNQHKIIRGSAWLDKEDENKFILVVKGYGNRCTWAHAFLNGLNTALIKNYQTNVRQIKTCKHKFYVKNGI